MSQSADMTREPFLQILWPDLLYFIRPLMILHPLKSAGSVTAVQTNNTFHGGSSPDLLFTGVVLSDFVKAIEISNIFWLLIKLVTSPAKESVWSLKGSINIWDNYEYRQARDTRTWDDEAMQHNMQHILDF